MLTIAEIKQFIDADASSQIKRSAKIGQDYYESKHDILNHRMFYFNSDGKLVEDKTRANVKIAHPFFTELVDQLPAFMFSQDDNPIRATERAEGLQEQLDEYFDDEFWAEFGDCVGGSYAKGSEYMYGYKNEDDRLTFESADSMGVVEVEARDASDGKEHRIYWYADHIFTGKEQKNIKRIQDWDDECVYFYIQEDNGNIIVDESEEVNPRPHTIYVDEKGNKGGLSLGFIPFWRLDFNKKRISGVIPIKPIIDDYDMMLCGLSNNLTDADFPIYFVKGFQGDNLDELSQNLKTKKLVGADSDGGIEVHTVDIPFEARKTKAEMDEKNIYRFGFGFNSSQAGDGNITNVVILSRYTLLDLKAKNFLKRCKRLLKKLLKVVLAEINEKNGTDYQIKDTYFDFKFQIPANESENIANEKVKAETQGVILNNVQNVAVQIGDEKALQLICECLDIDYEEVKDRLKKMKEEPNTANAQALLNSVKTKEPEEENTPEVE